MDRTTPPAPTGTSRRARWALSLLLTGALAHAAAAQVVIERAGNTRLAVQQRDSPASGVATQDAAAAADEPSEEASDMPETETEPTLHLGIVLYPGFEPLDVFGPLEMFMNVGAERLRIHMIAQEAGLVPSSAGAYPSSIAPKVHADVSLADAPPLDIILVPGGFGTVQQLQNQALLQWLRERAPKTRFMTSVCSGSAILAKAGLLDDKRATSNKQLFSFIAAQGPEVEWVKSARWVEDGAIITSSGVSAGIDMALALIAKLYGVETAEAIANATEYEWHRDPNQDPFTQYLDRGMPGVANPSGGSER